MKKDVRFFILFILLIISIQSCEKDKKELIPEDKFIEILIDVYKTQGVLELNNRIENLEDINKNERGKSVSAYNYLFKKHKVSRSDFSRTTAYYTEHTDKFLKIYDTLESYFNNLERGVSKLLKEQQEERKKSKDPNDLWNLDTEWKLPRDGKKDPVSFEIQTDKLGTYTLFATIKYYKDDGSVSPRITLILNYEDGTRDINSLSTPVSEEKFRDYEISLVTNRRKTLKSLSGWILDHSGVNGSKHAEVKDITLKYQKFEK